jgi:hypothetical protein
MKAIPAFIGLLAGLAVGYVLIDWLQWGWPAGIVAGFACFVAATRLLEWRLREGAERRALRAYHDARRKAPSDR